MASDIAPGGVSPSAESAVSAVSWPAIIAGAVAAVAVTIILLSLGSGMGLAAASPWSGIKGVAAVTAMTGVWLIIVQWAASAFGGYLTGRLRTRWTGIHTHEVFFRDTAHGFLMWALASLIVAGLTVWGAASGAGATVNAAAAAAKAEAPSAMAYDVDGLFRTTAEDTPALAAARAEAGVILGAATLAGSLPDTDRAHLAALAAARTGVDQAEAQRRVDAAWSHQQALAAKALKAADDARKAAAAVAFFTALSLLIGAFIGCVSAALGGQQRDEHP